MLHAQRHTSVETAGGVTSESSGEEVLVRPGTSPVVVGVANRNAGDRFGLPLGAHVVFCGTDELDHDSELSTSSADLPIAGTGPCASAYGSSIFQVSSRGASIDGFWRALGDNVFVCHPRVSVHVAYETAGDGGQPVGYAPAPPRKRKSRRDRLKPNSRERKHSNRMKIELIELCEEDREAFNPATVHLPDYVTSKPAVASKLPARLAKIREAALIVLAGGAKSVSLAGRAELGYGDRNSDGKQIKLKRDQGAAEMPFP